MDKMKVIQAESWGLKEYVKSGNLYSVRSTWEVRAYMLRVAGNYSHHSRYLATFSQVAMPFYLTHQQVKGELVIS